MSSISHSHSKQSISIPAPAHAERALTPAPNNTPPPAYTSPVLGAAPGPSRAPSPLPELRLETVGIVAHQAPQSDSARNRDSWSGDARSGSATASGTESDITSGGTATGPTSGQGLVHVPLNSPAPHSAAGIAAAKTPEQRARRDPIAMLLYLRRTVTLVQPPGKAKKDAAAAPAPLLAQPIPYNEKRKHRRHSSASASSDTTAVDDEEPTKEKDLAEPYSAAPAVNYAQKLPVVHVKPSDLEAQLNEADLHRRRSRKTLILLFIIIMVVLFLTSAALGIYSIVHHGF